MPLFRRLAVSLVWLTGLASGRWRVAASKRPPAHGGKRKSDAFVILTKASKLYERGLNLKIGRLPAPACALSQRYHTVS